MIDHLPAWVCAPVLSLTQAPEVASGAEGVKACPQEFLQRGAFASAELCERPWRGPGGRDQFERGQLPVDDRAEAGLHLLVYLRDSGATEPHIQAIAYQHSVAIGYLTPYWHHSGTHEQGVLIGYARPPATAFTHAVEELVDVLRAATSEVPRPAAFNTK